MPRPEAVTMATGLSGASFVVIGPESTADWPVRLGVRQSALLDKQTEPSSSWPTLHRLADGRPTGLDVRSSDGRTYMPSFSRANLETSRSITGPILPTRF